jgi:hypothetical protein
MSNATELFLEKQRIDNLFKEEIKKIQESIKKMKENRYNRKNDILNSKMVY